jgi:hypothetical protein
MKIFPLTIYVLLKPFIQILPSDSKKSLWDSRTTATLVFLVSALNLLAQFSRQIVIQILCLESPKVCGNLAICSLFKAQDYPQDRLCQPRIKTACAAGT